MRKISIMLFLLLLVIGFSSVSFAAENWRNYESGRDNIRLDGYNSQPGYIAFTDGDGTVLGYLYACTDVVPAGRLYWAPAGSLSDTTVEVGSQAAGEEVGSQ